MFELPPLDYAYNALAPHIDEQTMKIHHTKHHQAYVTKLNAAIKDTPLANKSLEDILTNISQHSPAVRNNGGGHWNHSMFWKIISPKGGGEPSGALAMAIKHTFGSLEKFQEEFDTAAATQFGSGWAWLCVDKDGQLFVCSTPNQDNPLMDTAPKQGTPVLALDVWEHAYYLQYQNRRPDYIQAFWHVVNWPEVERRYKAAGGN